MKKPDFPSSRPSPDPEHMLRARLRDTTPEFEARFDALGRRLAHESRPAPWFMWPSWLARPVGRGALALTAAAVLALAFLLIHPQSDSAPRAASEYGELVVLDNTLRDALPLIDAETLDALLLMPSDFEA